MQIVTYKSIANAGQKIKGIHGSTSYRLFFFKFIKDIYLQNSYKYVQTSNKLSFLCVFNHKLSKSILMGFYILQ